MKDKRRLEELKNSYHTYYKNYSIQFSLGLIWLLAAGVSRLDIQVSILALLIGITFLRPVVSLISWIVGTPNLDKDESLTHLTKLTMIGILGGIIAGFFPFAENINYFFPTFGLIFALIFGCIAYTSRLINFGILSITLITGSVWLGLLYQDEFSYAGFFSGSALAAFGLINWLAGKRSQILFLKQKKKEQLTWKELLVQQANPKALPTPAAKIKAYSKKVSS